MITIALCCLLVMLVLRLGLVAIGARIRRAQARRRYIPTAVRRHVLLRDGRRCRWCGSRKQIELDHIRPVSYGGKSIAPNLQVLCRRCNRRKGGRWCLTDTVKWCILNTVRWLLWKR